MTSPCPNPDGSSPKQQQFDGPEDDRHDRDDAKQREKRRDQPKVPVEMNRFSMFNCQGLHSPFVGSGLFTLPREAPWYLRRFKRRSGQASAPPKLKLGAPKLSLPHDIERSAIPPGVAYFTLS